MKKIKQYTGYIFTRILIGLVSLMPFSLLYLKADFVKFLLHKVVKYRKFVVQDNLKQSFPDKTEAELKNIENKFYGNLSDILMESVKGFSMNKKAYDKHYKFINPEIAEEYFEQGKDIIILAAHYNNWEWGSASFRDPFKHKAAVLYKPLTNKFTDSFVKNNRARFGVDMVPITKTRDYFRENAKENSAYILVADQSPSNRKKSFIIDFFNRKTYFLHGPEAYGRLLKAPVYYLHLRRLKRGYYEAELELICESPKKIEKGELTKRYAKILENEIRQKPEDWMWSHKRWKHKVPDEND